MTTKKVISKGYTLEVTSWENDGDNYNTIFKTVDSKELAEALYKMCKILFASKNNGGGGIGNSCDLTEKLKDKIMSFIEANPILVNSLKDENESFDDMDEDDKKDVYCDICSHWIYELLGGSEYYYCRVASKIDVTYSDKDIFMELITF